MVYFIIGEPASGKSTIVHSFIKKIGDFELMNHKKLRLMHNKEKRTSVLGIYDGSKFQGTDKLSMSVQPDALDFLCVFKRFKGHNFIIEGDRLNNNKFYNSLNSKNIDFEIFEIVADEGIKKNRHIKRSDNQSESFLKRIKTKISNIRKIHTVHGIVNNNIADIDSTVEYFINKIYK